MALYTGGGGLGELIQKSSDAESTLKCRNMSSTSDQSATGRLGNEGRHEVAPRVAASQSSFPSFDLFDLWDPDFPSPAPPSFLFFLSCRHALTAEDTVFPPTLTSPLWIGRLRTSLRPSPTARRSPRVQAPPSRSTWTPNFNASCRDLTMRFHSIPKLAIFITPGRRPSFHGRSCIFNRHPSPNSRKS